VLKRAYLMTLVDSAFCVGRACDKQTRDISVVTLDYGKIVGGYNTADAVVRYWSTK